METPPEVIDAVAELWPTVKILLIGMVGMPVLMYLAKKLIDAGH
jgi:hypothetical protein